MAVVFGVFFFFCFLCFAFRLGLYCGSCQAKVDKGRIFMGLAFVFCKWSRSQYKLSPKKKTPPMQSYVNRGYICFQVFYIDMYVVNQACFL